MSWPSNQSCIGYACSRLCSDGSYLDEYVERMKNVERFAPIFKYIEEHYREDLSVELYPAWRVSAAFISAGCSRRSAAGP